MGYSILVKFRKLFVQDVSLNRMAEDKKMREERKASAEEHPVRRRMTLSKQIASAPTLARRWKGSSRIGRHFLEAIIARANDEPDGRRRFRDAEHTRVVGL